MVKELNSHNTFCILICHSAALVIPIQDRWKFNSVMCGLKVDDVVWFHAPTEAEQFEVQVAMVASKHHR